MLTTPGYKKRARPGMRSAFMLLCGSFLLASPVPVIAEGEWLTVSEQSLEIAQGSPLDFSALTPALPDVRMRADGERLLFGQQSQPINCATLAPGFSETPKSGLPDHAQAIRYAEQLRRHGYNLVRFHYIDALLMSGAKRDFAFDPEQLDRFQFFVGELRKRGIHWFVDLLSSENAALGGVFPHRWAKNNHMIARTFLEPAAFRHWQELAKRLLTTPNPYTGKTLANDPHTAAVILVNEPVLELRLGLQTNFAKSGIPPIFLKAYNTWARGRGGAQLTPTSSPRDADFQRFLSERQITTLRAMAATVRSLGYTGLYTSFDTWPRFNQLPTRRLLPLIDMHGYDHDQVPAGVPGNRVAPSSSFDDAGRYLQLMGSVRMFGKPMMISEHDQVFWNPNRFESGLFAPTFAALQGWSFICRHADGPIDLQYDGLGVRKNAIHPDGGGLDPVARAGETLTALLRLRGEIRPLQGEMRLLIDDPSTKGALGQRQLSPDIGKLGWLVRLGITQPTAGASAPGIEVPVGDVTGWSVLPGFDQSAKQVDRLAGAKAISAASAAAFAQGRLEPEGGQVSLRLGERQLRVQTSQTSAFAGQAINKPVEIGPLRIVSSNLPGLIAFSALDAQSLEQSNRILVIFVANARNTGMQVSGDGTLRALGTLPVQLERMRAMVKLRVADPKGWQITPLSLAGERRTGLPLEVSDGVLNIRLDTALAGSGPTTYFLLDRVRQVPAP